MRTTLIYTKYMDGNAIIEEFAHHETVFCQYNILVPIFFIKYLNKCYVIVGVTIFCAISKIREIVLLRIFWWENDV